MEDAYEPSLRDMIMLDLPVQASVSPDGGFVAFMQRVTNWRENRYDQICLGCNVANGSTHSLTRTGNVTQVEWVDEATLALLRGGPDDDGAVLDTDHPTRFGEPNDGLGDPLIPPERGERLPQRPPPQLEQSPRDGLRHLYFGHWPEREPVLVRR